MADRFSGFIGLAIESAAFDPACDEWEFQFGHARLIRVATAWRIVNKNEIRFGWRDHGQEFGLGEPLDGSQLIEKWLGGLKLVSAGSFGLPCDLQFTFENGYQLQIFNDSSGYEGWTVNIDGKLIVAQSGGEITEFRT